MLTTRLRLTKLIGDLGLAIEAASSFACLSGNAIVVAAKDAHQAAREMCARANRYPGLVPDAYATKEGFKGRARAGPTGLRAATLEKAAPSRAVTGRTQFRSTSTASERLSISTETTRRSVFFSLTNMPSRPCRGPHSTRTRSPRSR